MDFSPSPEQQAWQRECEAFVSTELQPWDDQIERQGIVPESALEGLRRMGMFGLNTPSEYGGSGLSMVETCIAMRELAKAHIAYYYISGLNLHIGSKGLELDGTEEQKQRWLPEMASGRQVTAFALTEPGAGSNAASIATTAVRDGNHYILNGRKIYITNAPIAGIFTVFARTSNTKGTGGISAFIVEAGTPGLRIGELQEMLGGNGSTHAEVIFEDCRVPEDCLLGGQEGQGFRTAMKCLDAGRVCWGSYCVGAAERLLDLTLDQVSTRQQFGSPLAANQGIAWQLADMKSSLHAATLVAAEAA
jgi:acyl-CoA dehydrogenase